MSPMIPSFESQSESDGSLSPPVTSLPSLSSQDAPPASPYTAIIASVFDGPRDSARQIVQFVSAEARAGVTRTASAVAGELAASGRKVLLADAAVIASFPPEVHPVSLCERAGADRIWVLGSAQTRQTRRDFGQYNHRPSATLYALSREFPYIVLDAPALTNSDAALRLAGAVETILVVRAGQTQMRAAVRASERIVAAGGLMIGCVYNDHSSRMQRGNPHEM